MVDDDFRQRLIVRQSCLDRATQLVCKQYDFDETLKEEDDGLLVQRVTLIASLFESWVFRKNPDPREQKSPEKPALKTLDEVM